MEEICNSANEFLNNLFADMGFDLTSKASINDDGCLFDISGNDVETLLSENGEMLDALEVILFQAFGRELDRSQRFICDAEGFRQSRKAELQAMARFAAMTVRKEGRPFTFGLLNSTERRVIHTTLQEEEDLITESVGVGRDRRLQVRFK
jgi:spoIIIJ-associated protein